MEIELRSSHLTLFSAAGLMFDASIKVAHPRMSFFNGMSAFFLL